MAGHYFSPGAPVSFTNKIDHHDITEILLRVALNPITLPSSQNIEHTGYNFLIGCLSSTSTKIIQFLSPKRIYWYAGLHRFLHSSKHKNEYLASLKNNDRSQKLESA